MDCRDFVRDKEESFHQVTKRLCVVNVLQVLNKEKDDKDPVNYLLGSFSDIIPNEKSFVNFLKIRDEEMVVVSKLKERCS